MTKRVKIILVSLAVLVLGLAAAIAPSLASADMPVGPTSYKTVVTRCPGQGSQVTFTYPYNASGLSDAGEQFGDSVTYATNNPGATKQVRVTYGDSTIQNLSFKRDYSC